MLFDFDGTIADTGPGVKGSVTASLKECGFPVPDEQTLNKFMGPPIYNTLTEVLDYNDEQALKIVSAYRRHYLVEGISGAALYDGIYDLFESLHDSGIKIAVPSSKPQQPLEMMMKRFGLDKFTDAICGPDPSEHNSDKTRLLVRAVNILRVSDKSRCVMIGDRHFDIDAAVATGMHSIGAGYGYSPDGELEDAGADIVLGTPAEIKKYILG